MYTMKYGILGRSIDFIVGKKQSDKQIKMFFEGLKEFVEKEGKESSTVKL